MKKLILVLTLFITTLAFSQDSATTSNNIEFEDSVTMLYKLIETNKVDDSIPNKLGFYVATGLSVSNTSDFSNDSYASVEFGGAIENFAVGAVFGRNNLVNIGKDETLDNYWYELKLAASVPLGYVSGYGLVGIGSYIKNGGVFLEYGVGISKNVGICDVFVQVSNWDGITYVTPGVSFPL